MGNHTRKTNIYNFYFTNFNANNCCQLDKEAERYVYATYLKNILFQVGKRIKIKSHQQGATGKGAGDQMMGMNHQYSDYRSSTDIPKGLVLVSCPRSQSASLLD